MSQDPTCEQRIDEHLQDRLDDLKALRSIAQGMRSTPAEMVARAEDLGLEPNLPWNEAEEAAQELLDNYPLWIGANSYEQDDELCLLVQLSTGGPGDEFRLYPSADRSRVARIVYRFIDWWDSAERTLTDPDDIEAVTDTWGEHMVSCLDLTEND